MYDSQSLKLLITSLKFLSKRSLLLSSF